MELVLHTVRKGAAFTIYALEEQPSLGESGDPSEPLLDFLLAIEASDPNENAKLLRLLQWVADRGPLRNNEKCKKLEDDIYEFKTRGGLRVLWFYDAGKMIICTHGFVKNSQKTPRQEIQRAKDWKKRYVAAKSAGRIRIIEGD